MNTEKIKVLCVEDDKTTSSILAYLLKKWGYTPIIFENAREALNMLEDENSPQLILTDWVMPEMNGLEFTTAIRKKYSQRHIYIIILSSMSEKNNIVQGLQAGADDYIVKPFAPQEVECRLKIGERTLTLQNQLSAKVEELSKAIETIKTLEGLIPICMYCKKIRTTDNYWQQIEEYIEHHSNAKFTHGICEDCLKKINKENNLTTEKEQI